MSTSAEVADLEDVFAKASMPIQNTQLDSQGNTGIAKSSADILSEIQKTVLVPPAESKKTNEVNVSSVLSDSVEISEEIQEVLIDSTLAAENTSLVPVGETTKTVQETTSAAVTGSVELAEEIMEAFANSKNVLDTENPVSSDPSTLQEELDRLEQLAVERVREIEGDLVNSTKQIPVSNLSLGTPKEEEEEVEEEVTKMDEDVQKEFNSETIVHDVADTSTKEVGRNLCDNVVATVDLTTPSSELVSEIHSAEKEKIKFSSNEHLLVSMAGETIAQENEPDVLIDEKSELMDTNVLKAEKTAQLELEGKSDDIVSDQREKVENTMSEVKGEGDNTVSMLNGKAKSDSELEAEIGIKDSALDRNNVTDHMDCDIESKTDFSENKNTKDCFKDSEPIEKIGIAGKEGGNNELVGKTVESSSNVDIKVDQEIIPEEQHLSEKSNTGEVDPMKSADVNERTMIETNETTSAAVDENGKNQKIKDIQNYETEDDDLEVLEAFIVKTATNPELAVCTVQPTKDDSASKYSLESALLDDLTKTDNGSNANEGENKSDNTNENLSLVESSLDDARLAQDKASEKITAQEDGANANSKTGRNSAHQSASAPSGRKLLEKHSLSQASGDDIASSSSTAKGESKKVEKKVVVVEVKRRGRSLVLGKKVFREESLGHIRKGSSNEQTSSGKSDLEKGVDEEKTAKSDQNAIKKSIRNPKKIKISEESIPSTSGFVLGQEMTEHPSTQSGVGKIQKKHMDQIIDGPGSTSRSTLKNENKEDERHATVVKMVHSSRKEKKKPKDIKSNSDEKSSCTGLEVSDKRNEENDSKSNKKEERRLKENGEIRNVKGGSNLDMTNSRSTRSTKKIVTVKSSRSKQQNEQTKEKDKENVEKLTRPVDDDEDVKRLTERTVHKETPNLKSDKVQQERDQKSLLEGPKDSRKKSHENLQASAAKHSRGERDIEGLPSTRASTSSHNRAEKDVDKNSSSLKISPVALKQKGTQGGSSPDSGNVVKRKRIDKEIENSLPDIQLSLTSVKHKRGETEAKESSADTLIPRSTLKRKRVETEIKQISSAKVKRKGVEREFEQSVPNVGIEFSSMIHSDSNSSRSNLQRILNVYSDSLFVEFEDITFEMLRSKAKQLVLPTPLWGAQVSSEKDLVAFSRLRADLSDDDKPMIDKALVFQGSLKPIALINNEPIDLPIPCVRTFEDVVVLIRNFHTVSFCEGTGVKQRPLSKYCFRYLDVANPGGRCSQCLEERRRVLFGCARKLRERINKYLVMKAAKSGQ